MSDPPDSEIAWRFVLEHESERLPYLAQWLRRVQFHIEEQPK